MIKLILLTAWFFATGLYAAADVTSATIAAKVKSFDASSVTLDANGRVFKVKRAQLAEKSLHAGDSVLVTLHGKEIEAFAPAKK